MREGGRDERGRERREGGREGGKEGRKRRENKTINNFMQTKILRSTKRSV